MIGIVNSKHCVVLLARHPATDFSLHDCTVKMQT